MRTFIFLFCTTVFSLSPGDLLSQNSKIVIDTDQTLTVDEVFDLIDRQTDYSFVYKSDMFKDFPSIEIKKGVIRTNELLRRILTNGDFEVVVGVNNTIIIKEKPEKAKKEQGFQISGSVVDTNGQPLPGTNIIEKGTTNGTQADFDGNYSLSLSSSNATIVISFIGFLTQEVSVSNQSEIDVVLQEDTALLDQVVVVGYGKQKVTNLTGAVAVITDEALENRVANNASNLLAGTGSGITVTSTGGQPGKDSSTISIRGNTTFGGSNAPLVIVDGIEASLDNVDSNDIESISVLKDASASAIYGVRGGNGVIVVKTKRGKQGKLSVKLNTTVGFQEFIDLPDFANAYEFATIRNQALVNDGLAPEFSDAQLQAFQNGTAPSTNWLDELITGSGLTQRYHLAISGGSEKFTYNTSFGYLDTEGLLPNTNFQRYNFRTNFDQKIGDKLNIAYNLALSRGDIVEPSGGAEVNLFNAFRTPSTSPVRNVNGNYVGYRGERNAVAQATDGGTETTIEDEFIGTINISYEIVDGLTFSGILSATQEYESFNEWDKFVQLYAVDGSTNGEFPNRVFVQEYKRTDVNLQQLLDYEKSLGNHNFKLLLGHNSIQSDTKIIQASRTGLPNTNITDELALGDSASQTNNSDIMSNRLESYFGRFNYNFDEKYLLEASFRHDATSRFAPGNRKEFFPSFSVGWNLAKEDFFNVKAINTFKIRGSWGELGNQEIANSAYAPTFISGGVVENGGVQQTSLIPSSNNPDLRWETITKTNIGLDLGLFDNKLRVSADYFEEDREDILALDALPGTFGADPPFVNFASSEAAGVEANLNYRGALSSDFNFNVNFNFTYFTTPPTVKDLTSTSEIPGRSNGDLISNIFGYKALGLFQSDSEIASAPDQSSLGTTPVPGDIRYEDINGDGVINTDDRTSLGSYTPELFYGISLGGNYKDFDFSLLFQGAGKVQNTLIAGAIHPSQDNALTMHLDSWSPTNTDASYPTLHAVNTSGNEISFTGTNSYFTYNASYLRLKNVQVGYSLPDSITDKLGINKLRLFFSGENLLTFKNSEFPDGIDPEAISIGFEQDREAVDVNQTPISPFNSGNVYPQVKTFSFGLNVDF
ncbi:TonB-dependent receptor [Seonamhaeicola sp.]|uniref:SusC/RagA family TonB-linked outer membrane protein n=1 Tax=Seonamhaeicola sp. TaxID=1912245 RepID=UPI002632521B|nr:TonB-dependent receptor [Seonamhaeicola sp.]